MTGIVTPTHARGIRKGECGEARRRLMERLEANTKRVPPQRRRPWVKHWVKAMNMASGDMAVHTFAVFKRRPIVLHLTFEPLGGAERVHGLQLVTVLYEYNAGPPFVDVGDIHVTAHALERLVSRGHLLTAKQWVRELRGSVLRLYLLGGEPELVRGILALGPGNRFHVKTEHGYARVLYEKHQFVFVTWLHELDLSDEQRIEASLQEAEIAKCNSIKLGRSALDGMPQIDTEPSAGAELEQE